MSEEYPRKRKFFGQTECCGRIVKLYAETEEWVKCNGRWKHSGYGPSLGYCPVCGTCYIDTFDGCYALKSKTVGSE